MAAFVGTADRSQTVGREMTIQVGAAARRIRRVSEDRRAGDPGGEHHPTKREEPTMSKLNALIARVRASLKL
jgi:hypothetical protein